MLDTPVVLVIFNRPDFAEAVFQAVAKAKPKQLFVLADGPRSRDEADLCARTRAVTAKVDWDCDVKTEFSDVNLGCRRRCATGFDWVFSQVETAIILEDDCVPDVTFFPFCESMLERYRDDTRVMMVTGSNYLGRWQADRQSYHFSCLGSPWGWASWRRAWRFYDDTMKSWRDAAIRSRIRDLLGNEDSFALLARRFDSIYGNPNDRQSWDVRWMFARLMQSGLTIVPAVNLISNIGCSGDGVSLPPTHPIANLPSEAITFPLRFQTSVSVDRLYDERHIRRVAGLHSAPMDSDAHTSTVYDRVARTLGRGLARLIKGVARSR